MSDTPLDLPAGSFDLSKLDTALAGASSADDATRDQAVADAIAKSNRTKFDTSNLPAGYRRVKRKTVFNKGEFNELTVTENVIVLDLPAGDDVAEEPVPAAAKAPADPPATEAKTATDQTAPVADSSK